MRSIPRPRPLSRILLAAALLLTVPTVVLVSAPAPAAAYDGTPYPGPAAHSLPGTIQAEHFDDSATGQSYSVNNPLSVNQCGAQTWPDRDHLPVRVCTDGTDVWLRGEPAPAGAAPAPLIGSVAAGWGLEHYRYTVSVSAGWYEFAFRARTSTGDIPRGRIVTVVDGRQYGGSQPVPASATFQTVEGPRAVYLSGTQVIRLVLAHPNTDLDSFTVTALTAAPDFPAPVLIETAASTDGAVVADVVVDPTTVDPTGQTDSTAGIQQALQLARDLGGGTVFLPAGTYQLLGHLTVPEHVTLRGEWVNPLQVTGSPPPVTLLAAHEGVTPIPSEPLITLGGGNANVSHLSIWYPDQLLDPTVHEYPYTISSPHAVVHVDSVTLYNSYRGIRFEGGSAANIHNVYATCLAQCVFDTGSAEFSWLTRVHVSPEVWLTAPTAIDKPDEQDLRDYLAAHLVGLQTEHVDALNVYGLSVTGARSGWTLAASPRADWAAAGQHTWTTASLVNAELDVHAVRTISGSVFTDHVRPGRDYQYPFAPVRTPAQLGEEHFYVVAANGNDAVEDTEAFEDALTEAAGDGGGTVYVPPGVYYLDNLTVPAGVELRGAYTAPHTAETLDTTVLVPLAGHNASQPEHPQTPAFLTLASGAGVRGVKIFYPEQDAADPVPYPYTIRATDDGAYLRDVTVVNGYHVADFGSHQVNDFVIKGLWATALHYGVFVGGGSQDGFIEESVITYGVWFASAHDNAPYPAGASALAAYTLENTVAYLLFDSDNLQSLGASAHDVLRGVWANGYTTGPTGLRMYGPAIDTAFGQAYLFDRGDDIVLVGLTAGWTAEAGTSTRIDGYGAYLQTGAGFTGDVAVYGQVLWRHNGVSVDGGTVAVHDPDAFPGTVNVTQGRPVTASPANPTAIRAVDGAIDSRFTSTAATNQLTVDLGATMPIDRWVVRHAESAGGSPGDNTRTFALQVSPDPTGETFSTVATVSANTGPVTDLTLAEPEPARRVRLHITQGQQAGTSQTQIYEFAAYRTPEVVPLTGYLNGPDSPGGPGDPNPGPTDWRASTGDVLGDWEPGFALGGLFTTAGTGRVALYGCLDPTDTDYYLSLADDCDGDQVLRTEGWVYDPAASPPSGVATHLLYWCRNTAGGLHDDFVSALGCGSYGFVAELGYAHSEVQLASYRQFLTPSGMDRRAAVGPTPAGYHRTGVLGSIYLRPQTGTVALYSCQYLDNYFLSVTASCHGNTSHGVIGYLYDPLDSPPTGTTAVFLCADTGDHYTGLTGCPDGGTAVEALGFVRDPAGRFSPGRWRPSHRPLRARGR